MTHSHCAVRPNAGLGFIPTAAGGRLTASFGSRHRSRKRAMCNARLDTFLLGLAATLPVALIGFVIYSSIPAPRSSSGTQGPIDESVNGEVSKTIPSVSYADAPGEDVRFSEHEGISAAEMRRIGELKVVRSLRMPINATDEDLRLIRGLHVWSFSVVYSQVRGPGLVNLSEVEGLEDLGLGWAKIDDDGLAYLPQLKNLRSLHLAGRGITESGI